MTKVVWQISSLTSLSLLNISPSPGQFPNCSKPADCTPPPLNLWFYKYGCTCKILIHLYGYRAVMHPTPFFPTHILFVNFTRPYTFACHVMRRHVPLLSINKVALINACLNRSVSLTQLIAGSLDCTPRCATVTVTRVAAPRVGSFH